MELTVNPAYPRVTNASLNSDIQDDYNQVDIINSQPITNSLSCNLNPAYPRVNNALLSSDDIQDDYNQVDLANNGPAQSSNNLSSNYTVNPAYPRAINALLVSCDIQEDHNQVEIGPVQPSLSSDIREDCPQVEYISDLEETSCSSSSSEPSSYEDMQPEQSIGPAEDMQLARYHEDIQPTLYYEEIPDNIVSGIQSEQNCAYNITGGVDDPPPSYEDIVRSRVNSLEENYAYSTVDNERRGSQELYEVIPGETEEGSRTETHPPVRGIKLLCCFWQGRVELAIRLVVFTLGLMSFILEIMGAVTVLRDINGPVGVAITWTTFFITICCIPYPQMLAGCVEIISLLTRMCSKSISSKSVLDMDKGISSILFVLSLIGFGQAVTFLGLWSAELVRLQSDAGGVSTVIILFVAITVVWLLLAGLYLARACWMRAAINRRWDEKNAQRNALQQL